MIAHGKNIKVFSGNANRAVAEEIATIIGTKLGDAEVSTFSDGEISVHIKDSVRESDVFVIQPTCPPVNNNIMELLIMIDAFRRASAGRITAVMPYFGYGRQDRKVRARDPISAKLLANLITVAGADRILTMDLHASQIQGFFDIPVDHLLGAPILAPYFLRKFGRSREDVVVVSPDLGSVARARQFAQRLDVPLAIIDKRRPHANESKVMNIIGDVEGKKVIMVDDMIDTAGSIVGAANALVYEGKATEIYACATHGVLSGPAIERLRDSEITELVLLDTIPQPEEKVLPNMVILHTAPVIAEAIERIYEGLPVSTLFSP